MDTYIFVLYGTLKKENVNQRQGGSSPPASCSSNLGRVYWMYMYILFIILQIKY